MSQLINEACGNATDTTKNIGGKDQCFEGLVKTAWLADEDFSFPSIEAMRTAVAAMTAIKNKDIKSLPYLENPQPNNTEAQVKNGAWRDYTLKEGVPGVKYRIDTAICTHAALKSYKNSKYSKRIFEITTEQEILCEVQDDGTVKGQKLTSFIVGMRNKRTADDVPYTDLDLKFETDTPSVIKANYEATELEDIYDVKLNQVSASNTEIKFTVSSLCSGTNVASFEEVNFKVRDTAGAVQSIGAFTEADSDDVYTITGTGFANDFTLEIDGVVLQGSKHYEAVDNLTISGI